MEKIITDNVAEMIKVNWDSERFAIIHSFNDNRARFPFKTTLLNPREMRDLIEFSEACLKEK